MAVDSVVRQCLSMALEDDEIICDGLGYAVGWILGVLYAYDGILRSCEMEWFHGSLNVLIDLSRWIDRMSNVTTSKNMTCQIGAIILVMLEGAFEQRSMVKGVTY